MTKKILLNIIFFCSISSTANSEEYTWNVTNKMEMANGCIASIVISAERDFKTRAVEKGNPNAVFPKQELKQSIAPLCSCIVEQTSKEHSFLDTVSNPKITEPYIQEALKGGRCKPTGLLGKILGFE